MSREENALTLGSISFAKWIFQFAHIQVKMELQNVDESMGLDALLSLASGLPSHDSSLEDPLAMGTGDWVTSGCHGSDFGEAEKGLEESTASGPAVSTFASTSVVNITSGESAVEEMQSTETAALEVDVTGDDSSFSRQN